MVVVSCLLVLGTEPRALNLLLVSAPPPVCAPSVLLAVNQTGLSAVHRLLVDSP